MIIDEPEIWEPLFNATCNEEFFGDAIYKNNLYQVIVRVHDEYVVHLSIKRIDKKPIKNWRHFQYIKNQLCAEENFAIEIYPPESMLVDTANQYHLWVMHKDHMPAFAFNKRLVSELCVDGAVQEKWEDNMRPKDLMTQDQLDRQVEIYKKEERQKEKINEF